MGEELNKIIEQGIPGETNTVPDVLSRLPEGGKEKDVLVCPVIISLSPSKEELLKALSQDTTMKELREAIRSEWQAQYVQNNALRDYHQLRANLTIANELVMKDHFQVVPPTAMRKRLIQMAHEGHPGMVRTKRRIREHYWWPRMDRDVEDMVRECYPCSRSDKSGKVVKVPAQKGGVPNYADLSSHVPLY